MAMAAAPAARAPRAMTTACRPLLRNERTGDEPGNRLVRRPRNARERHDTRRNESPLRPGTDIATHDGVHATLQQSERQIFMRDACRIEKL